MLSRIYSKSNTLSSSQMISTRLFSTGSVGRLLVLNDLKPIDGAFKTVINWWDEFTLTIVDPHDLNMYIYIFIYI
jgi:hypothetical protein